MQYIFSRDIKGRWLPTPEARGPFAGLQGGAVAGLLAAEIEEIAADQELGEIAGVSVAFFRPAPLAPLHTTPNALRLGRRVSFFDNVLTNEDGDICAILRATLIREKKIGLPDGRPELSIVDPTVFPLRQRSAPHGKAWFMDAMEARISEDGTAWFRVKTPIIEKAGLFSRTLGPADWCHGINRPFKLPVADPNPDLTVRLARLPRGEWIGIRATTLWKGSGLGAGFGTLIDVFGEIGAVSMSVALQPFAADVTPAA